MASGDSKRFGSENKLLHQINGKAVFCYALENALTLKSELLDIIDKVIVVSRYDEIEALCKKYAVEYVYNSQSHKGISASVHIGLGKSRKENAVMFMVCDQPFMKADTLINFVNGFIKSDKSLACMSDNDGKTSNPCIFAPGWREALRNIEGDRGGKSVIKQNTDSVYFYKGAGKEEFLDIDIPPLFDFVNERGHVISIVGGGGKTTLMYALADMFNRRGIKTLITTTTHIFKPKNYPLAQSEAELLKIWAEDSVAVVGRCVEGGKLAMLDEAVLKKYIALAEAVIIEADGAKMLPFKVPKENEPVIIDESDIVIGVAGIDAVGKPLKEVCFRVNEACSLLDVAENHILTTEDIAFVLSSKRGTMKNVNGRKYYAVINKCDNAELKSIGEKIKNSLESRGISAVACSLKEDAYE
jgi:probable selenium-dependent hydroxylase accessory protein YqeC